MLVAIKGSFPAYVRPRRRATGGALFIVGLFAALLTGLRASQGFLSPARNIAGLPRAVLPHEGSRSFPGQHRIAMAAQADDAEAKQSQSKPKEASRKKGKALSEFQVGEEVSGKVRGIFDFGVFVDIGAERDALLNDRDDETEYQRGDEVTGLRILYVEDTPPPGRIAVTKMEPNTDEEGNVVFPGRQRRPGQSQSGPGQGPRGKMAPRGQRPQSTLPFNNYLPKDDEKRPELDGVYVPEDGDLDISYLAEKYPDSFSISDITVPGKATRTMEGCMNTDSELQFQVPAHLWEAGSQPETPAERFIDEIQEIETKDGVKRKITRTVDNTLADQKLSYDFGIKPEIHVKYRPYPFNNPNHVEKPFGQD